MNTVPTIKLVQTIYKVAPLQKIGKDFFLIQKTLKNPKKDFLSFLMKVGKLRNKFNALYYRSVGLAHQKFLLRQQQQHCAACAHTHVVNSMDTGFGLGQDSGKFGSTKPGTIVFRLAKSKAQQARLLFQSWHRANHSQAYQRHVPVDAAASQALCNRL